jgi:hypothetical protein
MRTPIATPPLMARRHSAERRHNDSYTGVMDTGVMDTGVMDPARPARHRSSRVGRRAETRAKPSRCLKEKETKRRWRHVRPGFLSDHRRAASARDHGGEAEFAASDSYRGRHDNHSWCRKFDSPMHHEKENPTVMRDFVLRDGETRTRTGDTTIFRQMLRTLDHARKRLQIALFLAPVRARQVSRN